MCCSYLAMVAGMDVILIGVVAASGGSLREPTKARASR